MVHGTQGTHNMVHGTQGTHNMVHGTQGTHNMVHGTQGTHNMVHGTQGTHNTNLQIVTSAHLLTYQLWKQASALSINGKFKELMIVDV